MLHILVQGMIVGLALAAPIGPINIEIVRRGLAGGFFSGWLVGIGAMCADVIFCALVVTGVAQIADSPKLRVPMYLAGAAVMIYLGVTGLIAVLQDGKIDDAPISGRRSFLTGFLMAVSNPMGIVYWLSIGSALIASAIAAAGNGAGPVLIAGVFVGITIWATVLGGLTVLGRSFVSPKVMRAVSAVGAVVLVGFGLYFAWSGIKGLAGLVQA
jgi:threonine/homoserine/homoserine lactone efflux protein